LETRIPSAFLQINQDALDLGIKMAENCSSKAAG